MRFPEPEPFIEIRGLSKRYEQRRAFSRTKFTIHAVEDVNLQIRRGTNFALVGESGAGKSTVARCLALIETPTAGEIRLEGVELLALRRKALLPVRRQIQIIFQDPASALNPGLTAAEIIAEPMVIHGLGTRPEQRLRALQWMEKVGLPAKWENNRPLDFSGGQRQRLAIARALVLEPKLLILDEALSGLDLANQRMILRILSDLQAMHSLTCIHVSHDLRMVADLTDEVAVMHRGKIVESGRASEILTRPRHPYTRDLLESLPSLESICQKRSA
ncbi:MAG: ABC transporter ATP-binding protein [Candidatus Acidiferrales bacterium]